MGTMGAMNFSLDFFVAMFHVPLWHLQVTGELRISWLYLFVQSVFFVLFFPGRWRILKTQT